MGSVVMQALVVQAGQWRTQDMHQRQQSSLPTRVSTQRQATLNASGAASSGCTPLTGGPRHTAAHLPSGAGYRFATLSNRRRYNYKSWQTGAYMETLKRWLSFMLCTCTQMHHTVSSRAATFSKPDDLTVRQ